MSVCILCTHLDLFILWMAKKKKFTTAEVKHYTLPLCTRKYISIKQTAYINFQTAQVCIFHRFIYVHLCIMVFDLHNKIFTFIRTDSLSFSLLIILIATFLPSTQ